MRTPIVRSRSRNGPPRGSCSTASPARERLIVALLNAAPSTTPLVIDLKACAADLHTVPENREGVLWLSYIRDPKRKDFWNAAKARVALLTPEQRDGLELRHLPLLIHARSYGIIEQHGKTLTSLPGP